MGRWNPFKRSGSGSPRQTPPSAADQLPHGFLEIADRAAAAEDVFAAGRFPQAQPKLAAAVADLEAAHRSRPANVQVTALLAAELTNLGLCNGRLHRFEQSVTALDRSLLLFTELRDAHGLQWNREVAGTTQSLATIYAEHKDWTTALRLSRVALDLCADDTPAMTPHQRAVSMRLFAQLRARAGTELDEALAQAENAIDLHRAVLDDDPQTVYVREVYIAELIQAEVLRAMGRNEEAAEVESRALTGHLDDLPIQLHAEREEQDRAEPERADREEQGVE